MSANIEKIEDTQVTVLSDRVNRIKPSATLAISAKAKEMRDQGIDIINLSVGEPHRYPTTY